MQQVFLKVLLGALLATSMGCSTTSSTTSSAAGQTGSGESASNAVANAAEPADLDPVRCERITPIGTRIGKRVCMRESEWAQMQDAGQTMTQDAQRRANQGNQTGG